ncbi:MAG: hypothetical protein C0459_03440 [Chitinophaga sp.]|jgi:hypothetical protein|nr:hypothetical protein [Chitinophaga sp.]
MYLGTTTGEVIFADAYKINGFEEVEIKKSVHQIVQTAKLSLPLSVMIKNSDYDVLKRIKIIDKIKEGDTISIAFGYDGKNNVEFTGFIKRINPKQPLELELEDEMYLLRKLRLKKSFKKNDIKDVLNYLMDELYRRFKIRFALYKYIPKVTITNMLINGANGIEVLQNLADKYLMHSYLFNDNGVKTLYCGLLYGRKRKTVKYVLNKNTINIENLKYQIKGDTTYKVEVINHLPNGLVRKFVFGDTLGEELKIYVPGNKTKEELKARAEAEIAMYGATGYKGKFETFIFPYIEPGDIANLQDNQFKDRQGNHYTGTVVTKFGVHGGRRYPEIDIVL